MNKTEKDFKQWIEKQIKYYKPYLDLNLQNIIVLHGKETTYLDVSCVYPYLEPTIRYSDCAFQEWKSGLLTKDRILHELIHIITDPLYVIARKRFTSESEIEDARERLTDTITVILNNLIK